MGVRVCAVSRARRAHGCAMQHEVQSAGSRGQVCLTAVEASRTCANVPRPEGDRVPAADKPGKRRQRFHLRFRLAVCQRRGVGGGRGWADAHHFFTTKRPALSSPPLSTSMAVSPSAMSASGERQLK